MRTVGKLPTLSDYVEDVQRCMRCGFCRTLCPTFTSLGWEASSPRGRMQLVKAYLDGQIPLNDAVKERIMSARSAATVSGVVQQE